jgi:TolA-binding protein
VREGAAGEARAEMTFKLAELLRGTGTPAERVTLYEQALQEAPTWERADEVSWQLALTLAEAGDPDRSEAQLTHLVEAWPTSGMVPDACMLLGDYSFERAHFEEARTRYTCTVERAPQLRPDLSRQVAYARYKLAWCAWALGDHAGAITMMREAVTMLGDDPALLAAAEQELAKLEAAAP